MSQSLLSKFGTATERVKKAILAIKNGEGVLVVDDENRENEGDFIFSAETLTENQMALMIREGSGIVCLCLEDEKVNQLDLPMMVEHNTSTNRTGFTVSIEAAKGVTTGVSAADRVQTIKTAIKEGAVSSDLNRPGHVFPLKANAEGVLARRGHTEASIDLMKLANQKPYGVLCEMTNPDGTMSRLPEIINFAEKNDMIVLSIEDIVQYLNQEAVLSCA